MFRKIQHKCCKIGTKTFKISAEMAKGTYKCDVITFRDIFTSHPPFPTASSFGTLVGGAHLMMSYLNKHFEPAPILCAVDFCLESRPANPIVYLVKKSESGIQKYLLYFFYLFRMCSM